MRPALKAELVLGGAVLAHLVVVETMFLTAGAGRNGLLSVARFFGLHVAAVMMVQLVLVARLPWLDRRLGMDRLTAWHRWVGIALAWTIACHATFVLLGFSRLDDASVPATFLSLAGVTASLLGMCAAAIVVVVVTVSTRWARRRLPYEVFRYVHLLLYVAIGLALVHQALEGTAFDAPLAAAYWWTMWALSSARSSCAGRSCRSAATSATASGSPRSSRSPTTSCRCTSPAATCTCCPVGRASSASGGSPATSAGGRRTRSRCPTRPTDRGCA